MDNFAKLFHLVNLVKLHFRSQRRTEMISFTYPDAGGILLSSELFVATSFSEAKSATEMISFTYSGIGSQAYPDAG